MTGINALDKRRSLQLSDDLVFISKETRSRWYGVSERFARSHFWPDEIEVTRIVGVDLLEPGDVDCTDGEAILNELSQQRAEELWRRGTVVE